MEERGQVAIEYLLTVLFAVLLVIAVTIIAFQVSSLADRAQAEVLRNKDGAVSTLMS